MVGGGGGRRTSYARFDAPKLDTLGRGGVFIMCMTVRRLLSIILITYKLARKTERRKMDQEVAIHRKQM